MVRQVNWNEEGACFSAICRILASFYAKCLKDDIELKLAVGERLDSACATMESTEPEVEVDKENTDGGNWPWTVEHLLLPAIRNNLLPSHTMCFHTSEERSPAILKLTSLPDLYKVFERC